MRTKEQNKEYINRYRFGKKVEEMIEKNTLCQICFFDKAKTLHHLNEDHTDNRKDNLQPVCLKCHLELKHKIEVRSTDTLKRGYNSPLKPLEQVLQPSKSLSSYSKIYGSVTLIHKVLKNIRLRCDVRVKTLHMLKELGYEEMTY
jgi:hypothetical protein